MIERVQISNFKSIRELDLPLKRINILIGANGAGKSNFLSFFKLVKRMYEQRLQNYVAVNGFMDKLLHYGRKNSDFMEGYLNFENTNVYHFKLISDNEGSPIIETEEDYYSASGENKPLELWDRKILRESKKESLIKDKIKESGRYNNINNRLKSLNVYHFHDTSETSKLRGVCNINNNRGLKEDGENLAAYLYHLQVTQPEVFARIEAVVRSIAPFFHSFRLEPDKNNNELIRLEWSNSYAPDAYFNSSSLSDGTLRFIALTTLLTNPEPNATIIIDEPELGLHPVAIAKLAALMNLAAKKSQLIVATQSAALIDIFEAIDIIVMDIKDGQSVFKRLDPIKLTQWLEDDYSLGELWNMNVLNGRP